MRPLFMRLLVLVPLLAIGCDRALDPRPPVSFRLYYPTGIAFAPPSDPDAGVGALWVANSNFDRRFDIGWVTPIDLSTIRSDDGRSLPPPGGTVAPPPDGGSDEGRPVQFTQLMIPDGGIVTIQSFAGLATLDVDAGRLFIPSRAENDYLAVLQTSTDGGVSVRCFFSGGDDCLQDSIPLAVEQIPGSVGIPAAPQPYSVSLAPTGEVYVSHLKPASSPAQSITNLQNYLVTLYQPDLVAAQAAYRGGAGRYVPPDTAFSPIGRGGSNSIVITPEFLYISGRGKLATTDPDVLLRVVDRFSKLTAYPLIQTVWSSIDARGLALHPNGQRLYLVADNPPTLLVLDIDNFQAAGLAPAFTLVRGVPLPAGPNDIQVIPRVGRAPLVAVSCAIDGSVAFYDDDLGQIAALVPGVGAVPFALAVDRRGDVARIFVSNFGDGRIAVIDVPVPGGTAETTLAPRIVGHIGLKQYCVLNTDDRNCVDPPP